MDNHNSNHIHTSSNLYVDIEMAHDNKKPRNGWVCDLKICKKIDIGEENDRKYYTRGVSWNLPVLLIDVARYMYTFLWFGIYVIFFYGQ